MKSYTLITIASLAALCMTPLCPGQQSAEHTAQGVASLTDAENITVLSSIRRVRSVALHLAADSIEQEENISEADFARKAAAEMTDELPADLRDFVHASSALICDTQEKLQTVEQQLRELSRAEDEGEDQEVVAKQSKPLFRQLRNIRKQHQNDAEVLEAQYPRAAFLSKHLGTHAVEEALTDIERERDKARAFLEAHPEMKSGKRATVVAYLRHLATEPQPEITAEYARATLAKLDLLSRLDFTQDGMLRDCRLHVGMNTPWFFPDDRHSGYSWKLATPLPEDSPVKLEWLTLPNAELKELQSIGILSTLYEFSRSPDTTIVSIHAVKEGKVTLSFIFSKAGEEPLLNMKITVEAKEED